MDVAEIFFFIEMYMNMKEIPGSLLLCAYNWLVITLEGVGKCLRKNWQPLQFGTAFFSSMLFNSRTKVTQRICVLHC